MRRYLLILAGLISLFSPAAQAANSTVAAMTAATAFGGTELTYIVQGGADRKGTTLQFATYIEGLISGDCTIATNVITCTKTNGTAFGALATATPGTGVATALGVNIGTAGSVVVNGGALGTPSSGVATNLTGTASGLTAGNVTTNANLTGAVTSVGNAASLGSFSSANLSGALTDETGSGSAVFGTAPTISSLNATTAATLAFITGSTQCLHVNTSGAISGTGSDCGSGGGGSPGGSTTQVQYNNAGAFGGISGATTDGTTLTLVAPVLGTPASGVATNLTGTAASLTAGHVTTNANLTGMVTSVGNAASLGSFTSANLSGALTDETGTGVAVFATSPTLVTPALGTPTALVGTNISGTGASFTSGHVTTNANLTGDVTSSGNATTYSTLATNAAKGVMEGDGSTISCTAGVCSSIGGGSGTVTSVSAGCGTSTGGAPITNTGAVAAASTLRLVSTTSDTVLAPDCGNIVYYSNAGAVAVTLPVATTSGFGAGAFFTLCDINATSTTTVTPTTSTIGGTSTLAINGGTAASPNCITFQSDGTNYNLLSTTYGSGVPALLAGASSGTGGIAGTTSPSFTTPALGTPSALVGTNISGTGAGFTAGHVTTNANLTGDVTSSGNATTLAAGSAANLNSGTLLAARMPALTGDCTTTAGAVATTCTKTSGTNFGTAATQNTGTSGATLPFLNGSVTFSGNNSHTGTETFTSVISTINTQVGTTYTLAASDCGKTVLITNASAITLTTLNSLLPGCSIAVEQGGAGQITVANGSGATLTSAHSFTKTFNATGAIIGLFVDTGTGANAHFVLTGDGA